MIAPVPPPPFLLDRFLGSLLGLAVADAVAAPFEGMPADVVYREFGPVRNILAHPPQGELTYTDDTQMTIAVAEALVADGEIRQETLAARFAENYDPGRGYGPSARKVIEAMRDGRDWQALARDLLPGGSFGNGAAMRVAPVALFFHGDEERLIEQTVYSALPTHTHPLGVEGAQLLALAIAYAMREPDFDRGAFFDYLVSHAASDEFDYKLRYAAKLTDDDTLGRLGNTLAAHESVVTAITCFALNPDSFEDTVARAVAQGGDVDTLAAMAAAISGARLGVTAVPRHLIQRLEDGPKGRQYIARLARDLHDRAAGG
jgi:poly(ADP-ribose) glycohydrolase ARH3